jgi:hypothetical protein
MLPRVREWNSLVFGFVPFSELWASTADHEATQWLLDQGREPEDPAYEIIRHVVVNVVHAAGGVEYTLVKIEAALDEEETSYASMFPDWEDEKYDHTTFVGPKRDELTYEYLTLLFWLRVLRDRIKGSNPPAGLIPMLAPDEPWTETIRAAYRRLSDRAFQDLELSRFASHRASPIQPLGGTVRRDGRITLLIPDVPQEKVGLWDQLTYTSGRDLRSHAAVLRAAVDEFIRTMASAFDDARAEITRRRDLPR